VNLQTPIEYFCSVPRSIESKGAGRSNFDLVYAIGEAACLPRRL